MPAPLLTLNAIRLRYGRDELFDDAELQVFEGDRVCLVGRNGSGKSTLMKIAAGLVEPDSGERSIRNEATVRYLEQEPDFSGHSSVYDYAVSALSPGDDPWKAQALLEALGLSGEENPMRLSGGEARRAALAGALAPEPDLLFLDEPTNHLDLPAIAWLESRLAAMRSALVLISHDRRFLETLTRRTVWIDRGVTRSLNQGFGGFEAWRDDTLAKEAEDAHKLSRKIAAEEDWLRYGVTARRKRNVRRLKQLRDLRDQRRTARGPQGVAAATAAEADKSGKRVIDAEAIAKAYDGRTIVEDLSIRIRRGDRIGLAGPNGSGKSTLVNLLTGRLQPDSGSVTLGTNLEMVTLDQRREALQADITLADALTGGDSDQVMVGGQPRHVMSYMKDFLFPADRARQPIKALSGGERGRLALAIALARPSNLLVLDEPTNDLDLETLDLLEETLSDYAGTVILVSHDRDFLDRTVTSLIAPDPERPGRWLEYPGGYSDMLAQRGEAGLTGLKREAGKANAPKPQPAPARQAPKAKLSNKERYALKELPAKIEAMEAKMKKIEAALADPDLYASAPEDFQTLTEALERCQSQLSQMEEDWLAAEEKREALEG